MPIKPTIEQVLALEVDLRKATSEEEAREIFEKHNLDIPFPLNQNEYLHLFPQKLPPPWKNLGAKIGGFAYKSLSLYVIMSVGRHQDNRRWLHVSLSRQNRIPYYEDVIEVKELFIGPDKKAIQVFPPRAEHVNIHPRTLHLWHCLDEDPLPDFTMGTGSI